MRGPVISVVHQSVLNMNTSLRPLPSIRGWWEPTALLILVWFSHLLGPGSHFKTEWINPTGGELVFSSRAVAAKYDCLLRLSRVFITMQILGNCFALTKLEFLEALCIFNISVLLPGFGNNDLIYLLVPRQRKICNKILPVWIQWSESSLSPPAWQLLFSFWEAGLSSKAQGGSSGPSSLCKAQVVVPRGTSGTLREQKEGSLDSNKHTLPHCWWGAQHSLSPCHLWWWFHNELGAQTLRTGIQELLSRYKVPQDCKVITIVERHLMTTK